MPWILILLLLLPIPLLGQSGQFRTDAWESPPLTLSADPDPGQAGLDPARLVPTTDPDPIIIEPDPDGLPSTPVPEPSSLVLLLTAGVGFLAFDGMRRSLRRRRSSF